MVLIVCETLFLRFFNLSLFQLGLSLIVAFFVVLVVILRVIVNLVINNQLPLSPSLVFIYLWQNGIIYWIAFETAASFCIDLIKKMSLAGVRIIQDGGAFIKISRFIHVLLFLKVKLLLLHHSLLLFTGSLFI